MATITKSKKQPVMGGAREGAGRPGFYDEATTTLTMRIPESKKEEIKAIIQRQLKKYDIRKKTRKKGLPK